MVSAGVNPSLNYNSLNDGDSIIIKDTIMTNPQYDQNLDITTLEFDYFIGYLGKPVFQGDLTSLYAMGDQVQISVTIKRVTFTLEPPDVIMELTYDLEIFEKQWKSVDDFVANGVSSNALEPLPQNSISKV